MAAGAVLGGIGAPLCARRRAEFSYKYANNLPDSHPLNMRAMLSQIRSGGIEFFTLSVLILAPAASVDQRHRLCVPGLRYGLEGHGWRAGRAMGIGLFAPPFGVGYYAACAIGRVVFRWISIGFL